ncbi:MAG: cysteine--tRNA ligase [Clostridia bacterium]|nr:cysteine--tRNA ligase [Clostridia bacterium]
MLKLYNTLTRKKEEFVPLKKGTVKMYSCGPTVYNYAHIGNMRAYIFMDTLRKVLKYNGYKVKHVMNITDVGHLVSDADEGEDKMAKTARIENRSVYEIAKEYTDAFMKDIKALNIDTPEHIAKATEHIREMEIYVNDIVKNGYAYETSKGVYFDTSKLPNYGKMLSNNNIDDLKAGARVEVDTEKRNPQDFALWIKAPKEHIMKWNSKWGLCYPGWHIECSAMSRKYLGDKFDIHTGGVDHIPIHHENEIAQSIGATGHNLANYWMHVEFLLIDGGKMSKSLGNVYTLNDLKAKGIDALSYRYFTYSSHYRNKLNFTWDAIKSAKNSLNKLRDMIALHKGVNKKIDKNIISKYEEQFLDAINDDMNMPVAISIVWEIAKEKEKSNDFYELIKKFDSVLSLDLDKNDKENINIPEDIKLILNERKDARKNKNFAKSDELRDKLKDLGYIVKDTKDGQIIEKV